MDFVMIETGWLSILPPIIAIVLALAPAAESGSSSQLSALLGSGLQTAGSGQGVSRAGH